MAREYFPHDFHARSELRDICMRFGMEGYGFYWGFVEILHESGGYIKESELAALAYELRVSQDLCEAVVKESGFFVVKKGKVTSDRVLRNLKKRTEISDARKAAAEARWKNEGEGEKSPSSNDNDVPRQMTIGSIDNLSEQAQAIIQERHARFYDKGVDGWIPWFDEKLSKLEDESTDDDNSVWEVRPIFFNLMDELKHMPYATVNRRKVHTSDYLDTLTYFFESTEGINDFCQVVSDVDEKVKTGKVKNKQNYLISALYNAAKMKGGGQH